MHSDTQDTQQEKPTPAKEMTVLYVLDSPDGILIPCKTAKGEDAHIPLNLLLSLMEKQVARRLRMTGARTPF